MVDYRSRKPALVAGFLAFVVFLIYQAQGIVAGDSGDLVTAAVLGGIPHPSGYPLFTLLGFLASKLPWFTPSWRVTLVSSIPHAVTLSLVYLFTRRLAGRTYAAIVATIGLFGNYLFFFYSVTPEVFALLDLSVIGLVFVMYRWHTTRQVRYFYIAGLILGLSVSHHHVLAFVVPGMLYLLWADLRGRKAPTLTSAHWVRFTGLVLLGLTPYLYVFAAASNYAMISWNNPTSIENFVRLITRADYGTFLSSGFYGQHLGQRLLQLKLFGEFVLQDLTWVGIVLAFAGFIRLWRRDHVFARAYAISMVFVGPLFLFYASFPLVNRFTLGTYERFLLPTYILTYPLIGMGVVVIVQKLNQLGKKKAFIWGSHVFRSGIYMLLVAVLLSGVYTTLWRSVGLRTDRTAENLARDIFSSVERGGIVIIGHDTSLFTSQYVRYGLGVRPDIILLHAGRLGAADYTEVLRRNFPTLALPDGDAQNITQEIVERNRDTHAMYTNVIQTPSGDRFWVPHGLLYRLVTEEDLPSMQELAEEADGIWSRFHDPGAGILSRYDHLMLADIRNVYAAWRIQLGKTFLRGQALPEALEQFQAAATYGSDTQTPDAYLYQGLSYLFQEECAMALDAFSTSRDVSIAPSNELYLYESVTYRDCVGDEMRADELLEQYQGGRTDEDILLETL